MKIVAVDDSVTMRKVLEMTFAGEDVELLTVDNGDAAVQEATRIGADMVLADASMTGVDGYAVARMLKSDPNTQHIGVIVLASQHNPYDEAKGVQSGVDGHVLKPFDTQLVIDLVSDVARAPKTAATGAAAPVPTAQAPIAPAPIAPAPIAPPVEQASPLAPPALNSTGPAVPTYPVPSAGSTTSGFGAPPPRTSEAAQAPPPEPPRSAAPPPVPAPPVPVPASQPPAIAEPAITSPAPPATPAVQAATGPSSPLAHGLAELGLTEAQVAGVLALSREVVERVVWEVVPDLAETIIRDEIRRLTAE